MTDQQISATVQAIADVFHKRGTPIIASEIERIVRLPHPIIIRVEHLVRLVQ